MQDKLGAFSIFSAWLAVFVAAGQVCGWRASVARASIPFAFRGESGAFGYLFVCLASYFLFLFWVKNRFYTNESTTLAIFLPVFFCALYNFLTPNLVVVLLYSATTLLFFLIEPRLSRNVEVSHTSREQLLPLPTDLRSI